TLYDEYHFFHSNALNRYSLGTKNKTLKYNADGSLTLMLAPNRRAQTRRATGSPRRTVRSRSTSARIGPVRPSSTASGSRPSSAKCTEAEDMNAKRSFIMLAS